MTPNILFDSDGGNVALMNDKLQCYLEELSSRLLTSKKTTTNTAASPDGVTLVPLPVGSNISSVPGILVPGSVIIGVGVASLSRIRV